MEIPVIHGAALLPRKGTIPTGFSCPPRPAMKLTTLLMAAMLLTDPFASAAENQTLELGSPFLDNMILQRGTEVPVWEWAAPGSEVTVAFADQTKSATTDGKGKWTVMFPGSPGCGAGRPSSSMEKSPR